MKEIEIKELFQNSEKYADREITVRGWIRTNRGSNKFGFIEINDGTCFKSADQIGRASCRERV